MPYPILSGSTSFLDTLIGLGIKESIRLFIFKICD